MPRETQIKKILIGVCTYARPKMLKQCLDSIVALKLPEAISIECMVVNNHPDQLDNDLTARYSNTKFPFTFAHCLTKGIPYARNVLLDYADNEKFDYCAFIDDDELAAPDWIEKLVDASQELNADVLQGQVEFIYAKRPWLLEPWMRKFKFESKDRARPNSISTCNVLVSRRLYAKDELGQRFDSFFKLTGGSDAEYFKRVNEIADVSMYYCLDALVMEETPEERCNITHYFRRFARNENNRIFDRKRQSRYISAYFVQIFRTLFHVTKALLYFIISIPCVVKPALFRKFLLTALKNTGRTYGALSGLFGRRILIYHNITGA